MRPTLHPSLVNGRFGDPALFVETLHRRAALLFDLGDLSPLSARDLLRITHVFVSHMHMDHFIGFDALLRVLVGREKEVRLVGPTGFAQRLFHKLQGYEWDLVDRYDTDLVFRALDMETGHAGREAQFSFKKQFKWEGAQPVSVNGGLVATDGERDVRAAILEHHGPSLAFSVQERAHVNVWKNKLDERGLPTGPWLQALKKAIALGAADGCPIETPGGIAPLGTLRNLATVTTGQKIVYVADVADTATNRAAITELAEGADILFIEGRFAAADAVEAERRAHLTTSAAGEIARAARVRRVEPFHFSPRYEGKEEGMVAEVSRAFEGR